MITNQALEIEEKTKIQAIKILETEPFISKNKLEDMIREYNGHASSGTVSRVYNKHRRAMQIQQRL